MLRNFALHKQSWRPENSKGLKLSARLHQLLHPQSCTPGFSMSLTIMRRIKFCAGHRLHKHGGKCEHFHGHNYMADFYVTGEQVDTVGRVIDFAELKKLFKGWLDENWDHGFVLNKEDENGLAAVKIVVPCRYYVLPYNPTSENMATYLLREVCPKLLAGTGVTATKVVIWESDESFAEASVGSSGVSSNTCGG
jgi:6-pyruvoyltetrahydropterin/6-carboxytetrahydropterin synthase